MRYGLPEEHIKIILDYIARHSEIEEAVLFGSRALGTYKPGSDVDIALKGNQVDSFLAAHLKSEIEEETCLPYFFDFVAYSKLSHKDLIKHVDEYGVVLRL